MKFWIKIIVSLCIVLVIGGVIWAFVLRKPEEVQAYNSTSELINYKESLGINEKLIDLRTLDYYNGDKEKKFGDSKLEQDILACRKRSLSADTIVEDIYNFDSYLTNQIYADGILEFLLPYTRSNDTNHDALKNLKNNINAYIETLKKLNRAIDEVIALQNSFDGTDQELLQRLSNYYLYMNNTFRIELEDTAKVILSIIDFASINLFGKDLKMDTIFALSDAYARSMQVFADSNINEETLYIVDSRSIFNMLEDFKAGEDIYDGGVSEYTFLTSYNALYNDYRADLNYMFRCKNPEKRDMAQGKLLSEVQEKAQPYVINVLNGLGF